MNFDRYMTIPFKDRGRAFDGADCLGMHHLILAHEAKLLAPDFDPGPDVSERLAAIERETVAGTFYALICQGDGAVARKHAQRFDGILMTFQGAPHVATAIGKGRMIHTDSIHGPRNMAIDDPDIRRLVRAVYRPKALLVARSAAA